MEDYSEKLLDYIDGILSPEEMTAVANAISQSPSLAEEYQGMKAMMGLIEKDEDVMPSSRLQKNFDKVLNEHIDNLQPSETKTAIRKRLDPDVSFNIRSLYKYAAAAVILILVGVMGGRLWTQEKQIDNMSEDLVALLDEQSTSQRIRAVNMSHEISEPSDKIFDALIETMNTDKSSNVRLAAVTALEKFTEEQIVVDAFINSLGVQEDPTVTIALINILANIKEQNAIQPLEQLLEDEKHMQFVKEEAQVGLFKLTSI